MKSGMDIFHGFLKLTMPHIVYYLHEVSIR